MRIALLHFVVRIIRMVIMIIMATAYILWFLFINLFVGLVRGKK